MQVVIAFLATHPDIHRLILRENFINTEGAKQLAGLTTVDYVDLSDNAVMDEGVIALAKNK